MELKFKKLMQKKYNKSVISFATSLKTLVPLWRESFEKDRMIQLSHFEWLGMWKTFSWRVLTLSLMRSHNRISNKLRLAGNFAVYLVRMSSRHGPMYTIKYLKASQLAISRSIAGSPAHSLCEIEPGYVFPRLTRAGLPKVIPSRDRLAIARQSTSVIRFWMTLFSVYRLAAGVYSLKLKTIVEAFSGNQEKMEVYGAWLEKFSGQYLSTFLPRDPAMLLRSAKFVFVNTSSPTARVSWHGAVADLHLMMVNPQHAEILSSLMAYLRVTGNKSLYEALATLGGLLLSDRGRWIVESAVFELVTSVKHWNNQIGSRDPNHSTGDLLPLKGGKFPEYRAIWGPDGFLANVKESYLGGLGQLQFKKEPAGKVRVFALVDFWTQTVLRPLHELLFAILRKLPNDGTFNQDASFKRCALKAKASGFAAGYDLSAATDRLPLFLQIKILISLGKAIGLSDSLSFAKLWASILVDRHYFYCSNAIDGDKSTHAVKYAVGQPMGALSSWAMLAVTHHMLVQLAHSLVSPNLANKWYDQYEIVGDDIQIFNKDVAAKYSELMSDLGVGLNMAKSVISPTGSVIEFVKRLSLLGIDVSPMSWRMALSLNNFKGRITMALWLLRKGFTKTQQVLHLSLVPSKTTVGLSYLKASTLALLTSLSGKRGISIESLIMGLIDKKKVLGGVTDSAPTEISVPLSKWSKAIADFFNTQKPVNLYYVDHFDRLDIEEEIEAKAKKILNYEIGLLVKKLTDRSYLRKSLVGIATRLWPLNEDNLLVCEGLHTWINTYVWPTLANELLEFESRANEMSKLKLKGLLQPKFLEAITIEKLLAQKASLSGIIAILDGNTVPVHKVPLENSLKLVKYILDVLDSRLEPTVIGEVDTKIWHSRDIL